MFCSAPGKGKFAKHDHPSGPWRNGFFRICAAHANGTVFEWTPEYGITYTCPGVDVVQNQVQDSSSKATLAILVADSEAMNAFSRLGKVTPNRFIQVWDELDKIGEILERRGPSSGPERVLFCAIKFMEFGLKLTSSVKRQDTR